MRASIAGFAGSRHELVALHGVAELVVGELQRGGRLALIPAAFFERGGEDGLFIFGDGKAEIGAAGRIPWRRRERRAALRRKDLDCGPRLGLLAGAGTLERAPGRFERIELDRIDR